MLKAKGKAPVGGRGKGKGTLMKSILESSSSSSSSSSEEESESEEVAINKKSKGKASPKKKTTTTFGGNAGDDGGAFSINKGYAERYNSWRNLEEQQKLKDRLKVKDISELDEGGSESESTSEEDEDWSPEKEKAFLKTLACLRKKDPKIYNDQFGFFKGVGDDEGEGDEKGAAAGGEKPKKATKVKAKPLTVRDHERIMVMEKGGRYSDDDEDEDDKAHLPKSYNEELASIRTEISKAAKNIDSSDEEDDTLLGSKLLKKRVVQVEEREKDEELYKLWLKGELERVDKAKLSKEDTKELKSLREYWADDKLDEGEKFLRDYILNKKYIDPLKSAGDDYIPSYNEVVHDDDELSNDEKFEADREEFEHKYNFRFEEPDQEFIKRYPRTIQDSLRREDTSRKEQRQKTKERKEETISKKREEVQRLKALKRTEIMDKIQKLHDISGNPDLKVNEMDLDGDFDPEEYDRRMQEIFNEDYYQDEADDAKPEFPFDEEIDGDEEGNWAEWVPVRESKIATGSRQSESDGDGNENEGQEHTEPSTAERSRRKKSTESELIEASKGRRGRRKRSAFLEVLEKERPKFDPKIHKSFEEYFDEYYKLDFEDVVGGDLKCRFKYHKTTANDFGLSVEEILKADDKELNQWASLKKTFQYRQQDEEAYEVQAYQKKSEKQELKKRILPSIYQSKQDMATEENWDEDEDGPQETQKKAKKKKKKNKGTSESQNGSAIAKDAIIESEEKETPPLQETIKPKKQHKEKKAKDTNSSSATMKSPSTQSPATSGLSKRQRKNQKKKLRAVDGQDPNPEDVPVPSNHKSNPANVQLNGGAKNPKKNDKKKGMKRKAPEAKESAKISVDEDRLRAYGINPTKFKKRMKYAPKDKA